MTTVLDTDQEEFVKNLAFDELRRLNVNIDEFLRKNTKDDSVEVEETIEKQLLLEDEKNAR